MLVIQAGAAESFDEQKGEFVKEGGVALRLEHSLLAVSKWESKFEKPFLGNEEKTPEEMLEYVMCMAVDDETPPEVFHQLTKEDFEAINEYINAKMTATWFSDQPSAPPTRQVITAELIYYWMTAFNIDFVCETWHLNRLFTLIRVCNLKSAKPKKMSRAEAANRQRELNAQRRAQLGTKG